MNSMHSREGQAAPGKGPSITVREECRSLEEFYPDPWLRGRLHYALAIPAEGVRATSVVCAQCRKPVEVEVRSPAEVTQYRWVMSGLAVAVPMLLVAAGKLLARCWWPNDAQFVPMPFALFLLGLFLEGVVLGRVLAPSDLIHFAVRTRGHARFHCAEAEWPEMDPLAAPPEPVPCLQCGATIPANRKRCSKCGWSYAVGEAGASS